MSNKLSSFISENEAPYAAKKIGVYDASGSRVGEIGLGKLKPNYGTRLYRFGFLSDVHNSADTAGTADPSRDLKHALEFFDSKESVSFTVVAGDITNTNADGEWEAYHTNINAHSPHTKVYACSGNHDGTNGLNIAKFKECTEQNDITYSFDKTWTGSDGEQHTDHFILFSLRYWNFTTIGDTGGYTQADLDWLDAKLTEYQNDRTFVIMHLFWADGAGNFKERYPASNWYGGALKTAMRAIRAKHPNVIWLSGHSHWKWYLQKYQADANIKRLPDGCWTAHAPSCANPIDSIPSDAEATGWTRQTVSAGSEGAVIDVYEDCIDFRGIVFKEASINGPNDSSYTDLYIPIAQYRLQTF